MISLTEKEKLVIGTFGFGIMVGQILVLLGFDVVSGPIEMLWQTYRVAFESAFA